jgi:uncharacterized OsmC-like protein
MRTMTVEINEGINVGPLLAFKEIVRQDPSNADRNPTATAEWVGGDQSKINVDGIETFLGGEGYLNPMKMLLACLAACDVDLIAMHASFMGIQLESLSVEATGHFNVQSYLGLDGAPGSGYNNINYTVRIDAPEATPDQLLELAERCERSSPVADSLSRSIPLQLEFISTPA